MSDPVKAEIIDKSIVSKTERETRAIAYLESIISEEILSIFNQTIAAELWSALETQH